MYEVMIYQPLGPLIVNSLLFTIPGLVLTVMYKFLISLNTEGHPTSPEHFRQEYDFIVVGAGSAGAVIANRLSESAEDEVLLLEAGGDETLISDVPALVGYLQHSEMDWAYRSEPNGESCLGMVDGMCSYPRGKVLGGSSVINYMIYIRGNRRDYDGWAALGNDGWSYEEVLPYFKKSEDNRNPYISKNTVFHSTGGELTISSPPWRTPLADIFVRAGVALGFENRDINSRYQTGFMTPQATLRDGSRCSTSKAFLRPIKERENIDIVKHVFVTKILIEPHSKRAYGVLVHYRKQMYEIRARKEVIISGGAINSPQLLMLSGIGPRDHLQSLNIPVIQDLPVGQNFQDHAGFSMTFLINESISVVTPRYENLWATLQYTFFNRGPLTVTGGCEGIAYVNSRFNDPALDFPDIQLHFGAGSLASDGGKHFRKIQNLSNKAWKALFLPIAFQDAFTIVPILLRPKSVGRLLLRSNNPFHKPYVDPNHLSSQEDVAKLVDAAKLVLQLVATEPFQEIGARYHYAPIPICPNLQPMTEQYFECLLRYNTFAYYHAAGTVKMGPMGDPTAVVDPQLRVKGIYGLRVADASIMPNVMSGNTHAPTVMIGEKAADMIKEFWRKR